GMSCLLAGSHVLSSVDKTPPRSPVELCNDSTDDARSFCVLPLRDTGSDPHVRPLKANVRVEGAMLQITNMSDEAWQDIGVQIETASDPHPVTRRLPRLVPFETRRLPLSDWQTSPYRMYACPATFYVRWHCRTRGGR